MPSHRPSISEHSAQDNQAGPTLPLKVALRDASFYACPSGHGVDPPPPKYHAIVDRPRLGFAGPACGIPFHTEETERDASTVSVSLRCGRPGCRAAFQKFDDQGATHG